MIFLIVASIAILLAMSGFATWNVHTQRVDADWVLHTAQVRYQLSRLLQLLIDTQTGARGFALTGSDRPLKVYAEAFPRITPAVEELKELISDNPEQRPLAAQIDGLARELQSFSESLVNAARGGNATQVRSLIDGGHADDIMTNERALLFKMQTEEDRLMVQRLLAQDRARRDATFALWGTGGLGAALLVLMVYLARRDEAKLHLAERELATTLRSIGDAVISTDVSGTIRFMNPVAEQLTGWKEPNARGLPVADVFRIIGEETRVPVESPERQVLQEGKTVKLANHTILISKDGTERAIADSGAPIVGDTGNTEGMVLVFRDVSEARRAERTLQMRDTELQIINEYARFPVAHCDTRHHFLFVNKAYADRLGLRPEDCVGKHISEVVGEPAYQSIRHYIDQALAGRVAEFETEIPYSGKCGSRWMHCIYAPVRDDRGAVSSFVAAVTDVTARIAAERELRHSKEALQETDRRKDEFIATLSHELRNPLAPIRTAAKIIAAPQLSPTQLQRAQTIIERQVTHMALLLDDLLDIARITQGKLNLKKEPVVLFDVVDAAVEAARPALNGKNHHLAVKLPPDPIVLEADPVRLSQILSNLLTNAAKYSDPGSHIEIIGTAQDHTLMLSVKDDGIGISGESITGIFDMFSQVEGVRGRSDGGLGIGLALVKGLTELHGGTIEARSDGLGHGSEFIVRLPLSLLSPLGAPQAAPTVAPTVHSRILIADDNRDAADSLSMLLELAGHEVRVAHLGRAALSLAQAFRPDVALLDIGMPDLSGYEVAQALRKESWGQTIKLIALTGWGQERDRQEALEAGFDHHLTKPIDPNELEVLIGHHGATENS
jgi:PAS domain S-box-containing protein